jgi:hypothetical protein
MTTLEPAPTQAGRGASASAPLAGKLRPLTGYEEEFIERNKDGANAARLCNEVLARCLIEPAARHEEALEQVRSLIVAERDRLLVLLRQISLGDQLSTEISCPECRRASRVDFPLSALSLDFAPPPPHVEVEVDGIGPCRLRLPTAGDQEAILDADAPSAAEKRTLLLSFVLLQLGAKAGPFTPAAARALPTRVRQQLEAALNAALPDFDFSMNVQCPDCGAAFHSAFDIPSFFLPSCGSGEAAC